MALSVCDWWEIQYKMATKREHEGESEDAAKKTRLCLSDKTDGPLKCFIDWCKKYSLDVSPKVSN